MYEEEFTLGKHPKEIVYLNTNAYLQILISFETFLMDGI
jgi:hypothetical protein